MGLDNGIIVKGVTRAQLPRFYYPFDEDFSEGEVEICYWRKWWTFRNLIIDRFRWFNGEEVSEYKLSVDDVRYIRQLLIDYLHHPKQFESDNNFREFKEVKGLMRKHIRNLQLLARWMQHNPDKEVYFYDSY